MITKLLLEMMGGLISFLASLFDVVPGPPAFLTDLPGYVDDVAQYMTGTSVWLPWTLTLLVIGLWAAAIVAGVTIKIIRIVASFATLGGGSAA